MLKNTKMQMLLVLVVGASLGYAAASGKLNPFQKSGGSSPQASSQFREDRRGPAGRT